MNYFQTSYVASDVKDYIIEIMNLVHEQPIVTRTVAELLWGYQDDALAQLLPGTNVSIFNASVIEK